MALIPINLKEGTIETNKNIIVGIDLGTTNSLVAVIKDGDSVAISDTNGKSVLVPSIVHFTDEGEILVGDEAKERLVKAPERTIYSVKRLLGRSYKDVNNSDAKLAYNIIDNNDEELVKIQVEDRFYSPVELSAEILKYLKSRAETALKTTISKAVITVPAYFNDSQRQATRDAGKIAGLDVLRVVNEPTAASLAYGIGLNKEEQKTIAVYDLGGGTFDISVLTVESGIFEVLSTNGNTYLGGDDIDNAIVKHWLSEYFDNNNKFSNTELRLLAEEAKKNLSNSANDLFDVDFNGTNIQLKQNDFNALLSPLLERTIECCSQALKDAKLSKESIDEIVLVGGSTRLDFLKDKISSFFGKRVNDSMDPDKVVAQGAAIQADILAGNRKDILLFDITPLSLGIETVGGLMDVLIPRNSKIPQSLGRSYTTSVDGQTKLKVAVYQGERNLVSDNRKLGEFIFAGIPPMAAGLPKIEIQFMLDTDGILKVNAKELRSNQEASITIKSTYGISEEEMAIMLMDSIKNAASDIQQKALIDAVVEANHVLDSTSKFISQNEDILSPEQIEELKDHGDKVRSEIEVKNKDGINSALENLNAYARPLAELALDRALSDSMKDVSIE